MAARTIRRSPDNPFDFPIEIVPPGVTYQWNTIHVLGEPETAAMQQMAESGWVPVPASRHPRMFTSASLPTDWIVVDGMRLEERPTELTAEARREELAKAYKQVDDLMHAYKIGQRLPDFQILEGETLWQTGKPPMPWSEPGSKEESIINRALPFWPRMRCGILCWWFDLTPRQLDAAVSGLVIDHRTKEPVGIREYARRAKIMKVNRRATA